jgi:hypothetical protein
LNEHIGDLKMKKIHLLLIAIINAFAFVIAINGISNFHPDGTVIVIISTILSMPISTCTIIGLSLLDGFVGKS